MTPRSTHRPFSHRSQPHPSIALPREFPLLWRAVALGRLGFVLSAAGNRGPRHEFLPVGGADIAALLYIYVLYIYMCLCCGCVVFKCAIVPLYSLLSGYIKNDLNEYSCFDKKNAMMMVN